MYKYSYLSVIYKYHYFKSFSISLLILPFHLGQCILRPSLLSEFLNRAIIINPQVIKTNILIAFCFITSNMCHSKCNLVMNHESFIKLKNIGWNITTQDISWLLTLQMWWWTGHMTPFDQLEGITNSAYKALKWTGISSHFICSADQASIN